MCKSRSIVRSSYPPSLSVIVLSDDGKSDYDGLLLALPVDQCIDDTHVHRNNACLINTAIRTRGTAQLLRDGECFLTLPISRSQSHA